MRNGDFCNNTSTCHFELSLSALTRDGDVINKEIVRIEWPSETTIMAAMVFLLTGKVSV